jgi:hypothetical protein
MKKIVALLVSVSMCMSIVAYADQPTAPTKEDQAAMFIGYGAMMGMNINKGDEEKALEIAAKVGQHAKAAADYDGLPLSTFLEQYEKGVRITAKNMAALLKIEVSPTASQLLDACIAKVIATSGVKVTTYYVGKQKITELVD